MKLSDYKSFMAVLLALVTVLPLSQSCKENEPMKWVDLRYRVDQDSYVVDIKGTETITFLVKSTDPWEVFGSKRENWYTISPDRGEAGETYTVTITCEENFDLDDRADTINIKSDYWLGKQFLLTQKGTAYLNYNPVDEIIQEGGSLSIKLLSNQKWSVELTEGSSWLSLGDVVSGEGDGTVTVSTGFNSGERRTGVVTVYDRHGAVAHEIKVTQRGVLLEPQIPENGNWFQLYQEAQTLEIQVESNARWTVAKGNPADDDWYTIENDTFEGNGVIRVNVEQHGGSAVRTADLILTSIADAGAVPVVKTVRFKQANPPIVTTEVVNKVLTGGIWYGNEGLMPARYNFYLESYTGDITFFWILKQGEPYTELRYHIKGGITDLSTTPWCSNVHGSHSGCKHPVDGTKQNILSLNIDKYVDENGDSWMYCEWLLNDKVIAHAISDGKNDDNGTDDTFKVPYANTAAGARFQMSGNLTVSKWERVDHIVWE